MCNLQTMHYVKLCFAVSPCFKVTKSKDKNKIVSEDMYWKIIVGGADFVVVCFLFEDLIL